MKLFIILSVVAWSSAAKLDRTYLPPNSAQSAGGSSFLQAPTGTSDYQAPRNFDQNGFTQNQYNQNTNNNGFNYNDNNVAFGNFEGRPAERAQAAFERNAAILRQDNANDGETYAYAFETENGIYGEENGVATNGVEAQGGYSYTGDDGQVYSVRYTAGENGFVPQGDHLPTPPPVPEEILKALEQNARDEAAGIYDDGSYSEGKYSNSEDQNQYNDFKTNNGGVYNGNDEDSVVTNSAAFSRAQNFAGLRSNGQEGVTKAYLPPFEAQRQTSQPRTFTRQSARATASNTYLPPFANQRNSARRPSFNARDGYQY